jgi:hypothetical protein
MKKDTYWAIRRREIAKAGVPVIVEEKVKKPKKAKAAKAEIVEEVIEAPEPESNDDADVTVEPA